MQGRNLLKVDRPVRLELANYAKEGDKQIPYAVIHKEFIGSRP